MPAPSELTPEQKALLTTGVLKLASELHVSRVRGNRIALKYRPGRTHLMMTPEQWGVLQCFHTARRAPDVLCELISNRQSPPLAEYYELLIKAVDTGLLQTDGHPLPPPVPATPWRGRLHATPVLFLSMMAFGFGSVFIALRPMVLPTHAWELILGWVLVCLTTSLGYWLAASTLNGADGVIYSPRWTNRSLTPHYTVDLDDTVMLLRSDEINVALARLAPHFAIAFITSLYLPGVLFPVLLGLIWQLAPVGQTPLMALLRALYRDPPLDTAGNLFFTSKQSPAVLLLTRLKVADKRFLFACGGYTVAWLLLLFLTGSTLLGANAWELIARFRDSGSLRVTAFVLLFTMSAMVLAAIGLGVSMSVQFIVQWYRARRDKRREKHYEIPSVDTASISKLLAEQVLFRDLPPAEFSAVVASLKPESHPAGDIVIREGEPGDKLYIIYGGAVEVLRGPPGGPFERVAELSQGAVFGEVALLRGGPRTRTVRCTAPSVLLSLSKREFDALVISRLSREAVETAVQKVAFLKRIPISSNWSSAAIAAFAKRSTFREFHAGEKLVVHGDTNQFFHVVYEGEIVVEKAGREVAILKTGDFFGEISLLQSSTATAAVTARTPGRCLMMIKRDFLEFVSRDFLIGLQFEDISSSRIGRPIFPLAHAVFITDQR
ncbi:MAG: hypothetical protein RIQ79_1989 [Verrucomicrobiota bacterium]|jgi:CRP-like cAMP-binding protein